MSRPWLEEWYVGKDCVDDGEPVPVAYLADKTRQDVLKLIAAAPALVRALLAVEYGANRNAIIGGWDRWVPCCPSCEACPAQNETHADDCQLDAALTAAGLPGQVTPDEARKRCPT